MRLVLPELQALPASLSPQTNNQQARLLATTPQGRQILQRFTADVAALVETEDARRCAARAEEAEEWQPAFEAAVEAQRELSMALWGEQGPPTAADHPQAQRDAWSTQNDALELLTRRLLDAARGAA